MNALLCVLSTIKGLQLLCDCAQLNSIQQLHLLAIQQQYPAMRHTSTHHINCPQKQCVTASGFICGERFFMLQAAPHFCFYTRAI